jgi:hypothetical protein
MTETALSGSLEFLPRGGTEFADRAAALARAASRALILHPWTEPMRALAAHLAGEAPAARLCAHESEASAACALPRAAWSEADSVILDSEPRKLADDLLQLVDLPALRVLAPRTEHFFRNRPLFIVSIPKSGSHLLYRLAGALGYAMGIAADEFPRPGQWYFLEYFNSHTEARNFFVDSSFRRAPWSNTHHAFASTPVLFMYRHPLDVLVSEANYFHREDRSVFAGYLAGLTFEQRVHRLLDDPWLLGTIRERTGAYAPWLEFPNVIPLSFEELVGPQGGGDRDEQLKLIWSVQLKLQVPGVPHAFADQVFDRGSPTFHQGLAGAWRSSLSGSHLERLRKLNQDFMAAFGYDLEFEAGSSPRRATEFRRRPLRVTPPLLEKEAIALEYNYLGFNLLRFDGWIYAVPQATGPGFDLRLLARSRLRLMPRERSLSALKHRLFVKSLWWGGNPELLATYVAARLARADAWGGAVRALLGTLARGLLRKAKS